MSTWMQAFEENDWHFASFFESRSELGHDIAHLLSPNRPVASQDNLVAAAQANHLETGEQESLSGGFEPFPEPKTMPGGWDLTEFL